MSNEQAALNLTPHLEQMNMCNLLICGSTHEAKIIKNIICELNKPAKWNYLLLDITTPERPDRKSVV